MSASSLPVLPSPLAGASAMMAAAATCSAGGPSLAQGAGAGAGSSGAGAGTHCSTGGNGGRLGRCGAAAAAAGQCGLLDHSACACASDLQPCPLLTHVGTCRPGRQQWGHFCHRLPKAAKTWGLTPGRSAGQWPGTRQQPGGGRRQPAAAGCSRLGASGGAWGPQAGAPCRPRGAQSCCRLGVQRCGSRNAWPSANGAGCGTTSSWVGTAALIPLITAALLITAPSRSLHNCCSRDHRAAETRASSTRASLSSQHLR